ncbi:4-oxalmesaconate hydratase [Rubripirellula lacrimiformis]|uniref:4-oxalmesaconate hydratase n=1 Tax=Rubripirellula lacrimiformis TaxID=1930273 RepID=A0A517NET8_9BACT|nr:PIG-L family deacetylase [Rubripirellula lacrimiformis]QDT05645.1 4-oxalmesaconate hydratase [Rubripirellula lacrimiformis]
MTTSKPTSDRKVALAFMAHPDDAEITCAGTLIRLARLGWTVHIATTTGGDCGALSGKPEDVARMRFDEGTAAAKLMGATFHCLNEPDGRLVYDRTSLQKSIDLFRQIAPTLVITMPMSDYHADHEVTGQLGRAASFVYAAPNASKLDLVDGSQVPHLYYCDGHGGEDRLGNPISPTTYVEVTEQMDLKTEMLACHASQREWLRSHNGIDNYLSAMRDYNLRRGSDIGVTAAESFVQHRGHGHPHHDLLSELFPTAQSQPATPKSLSETL